MDALFTALVNWLARNAIDILKRLWGLLAGIVFVNPDVSNLPQVAAITARSQLIANTCFILAVLAAAVTVMTRDTVQARYGVAELAPRLVIGFLAANFAAPICKGLITGANTLTGAL